MEIGNLPHVDFLERWKSPYGPNVRTAGQERVVSFTDIDNDGVNELILGGQFEEEKESRIEVMVYKPIWFNNKLDWSIRATTYGRGSLKNYNLTSLQLYNDYRAEE